MPGLILTLFELLSPAYTMHLSAWFSIHNNTSNLISACRLVIVPLYTSKQVRNPHVLVDLSYIHILLSRKETFGIG